MASTDYQALINQAVAGGNYYQAAVYEQQRNNKINQMNASGNNPNGYTTTNLYSKYLNGGGGGTDYQALINQAVANNNLAQAAQYEQLRNEKIGNMNAAGNNPNGYTQTNLYSQYLGQGNITPAQQVAQAISPATYSQRATTLDNMAGAMAQGSTPAYQAPDTSAYDRQIADVLAQLQNRQYVAPQWSDYYNERSLDDYVAEAIRLLDPTYREQYAAAATQAAQNLDRAGIYNSLYGQALAQNAENAVTRSMLTDASNQARQARQQDYENAFRQFQAAADNAQFAYNAEGNRLNTVINSLHNSVDELMERAAQSNNYQLQAAAQDIQRRAAAADMLYQAGQIQAQEYANMLAQEQIKSEQMGRLLTQAQLEDMAGIQRGQVYQVNPDGKAPKGLSVGDYVNTNGGMYQITGVAADGSYTSKKMPAGFDPYALANPINAAGGGYSGGGSGRSSSGGGGNPVYDGGPSDDGGPTYDGRGSSGADAAYYGNLSQAVRQRAAAGDLAGAASAITSAYESGKISAAQKDQLARALGWK